MNSTLQSSPPAENNVSWFVDVLNVLLPNPPPLWLRLPLGPIFSDLIFFCSDLFEFVPSACKMSLFVFTSYFSTFTVTSICNGTCFLIEVKDVQLDVLRMMDLSTSHLLVQAAFGTAFSFKFKAPGPLLRGSEQNFT